MALDKLRALELTPFHVTAALYFVQLSLYSIALSARLAAALAAVASLFAWLAIASWSEGAGGAI